VEVVAITTARPAENQQAEARAGRKFPFPVLTDINRNSPLPAAHQQWGLYDEATGATREGLFLVDRAGMVAFQNGIPEPVIDPDTAVDVLCRGEWPD
jgi:alkyl hydroperoxide reductase subunit AhpC